MNLKTILPIGAAVMLSGCGLVAEEAGRKTPADYVNPYIGNVSHMLVPTFPNVHLPNSMLRVVPERDDYTSDRINGLPIVVTNHREKSAFNLSPFQGERNALTPIIAYSYDNEELHPYSYSVFLDEPEINVRFAPSHQSAVYEMALNPDLPAYIIVNSGNGALTCEGNVVKGYRNLDNGVRVYLFMETMQIPKEVYAVGNEGSERATNASGDNACLAINYDESTDRVNLRYGVSLISEEQAERNLHREITNYDVDSVANAGKEIWDNLLGKFEVETDNEDDKTIFYTALYRVAECPICISEDGRYFNASDGKVHDDEGHPFYTDNRVELTDFDSPFDYRWDETHNIPDLIMLMGGPQAFNNALDEMYGTPLGKSKFDFYAQYPDHTGNVGRFSMADESSLHVPYLYNYSGQPWKTQKRIRSLMRQWFRNDLMGMPGEEEGGSLSGFIVYSMLGFYPVTPDEPAYTVGSPIFSRVVIHLDNGKDLEIIAHDQSESNKYIQSARINGKELTSPWFSREDIKDGGRIEFVMGPKANYDWGKQPSA